MTVTNGITGINQSLINNSTMLSTLIVSLFQWSHS